MAEIALYPCHCYVMVMTIKKFWLTTTPNSRSYLNHFTQPDSIVPDQIQGVQAWDRYAYTNNNPMRYTDPSGHCIGLSACLAQIGRSAQFLASRMLQKRELSITSDDWEDAADYAAPAIASGSKESVSLSYGAFATAVQSTTLITTDGGDVQVFDETNMNTENNLGMSIPEGGGLPGVTASVTHGLVFGLDGDALNYSGDAVQMSAGLPAVEIGGITAEGYISTGLNVGGVDAGLYIGIGPTILSGAKTFADPDGNGFISGALKSILPEDVDGFQLFACRMASMCGAK